MVQSRAVVDFERKIDPVSASTSRLVHAVKQNQTLRRIANSTLAEVALEPFNRRLPFRYRFMRLVSRSNYLRAAAVNYYSRCARQSLDTTAHTLFRELDVNGTGSCLEEKGFALGIVLPPDCLASILAFCAQTPFLDDCGNKAVMIDLTDEKLPRAGVLAYRCPDPHKQCETVEILTRDPALVGVARAYLRAEPLLRSSRIFWSYPELGEGYSVLYGFHYDIDDYKFLKVFFYLCDVDESRGPHVIIEGTHRKKDWFEKGHRRLTDEQAAARYRDRIKVMTGAAGHGFFEDTFCYHKGAKPQRRRLMLEFQYAISPAAIA